MKTTKALFLVLMFIISSNLNAQYCTSSGHNNATEWIESVSLNTLSKTSGMDANGYGDFTLMTDSLLLASFYMLSVEVGGTYTEYVDAWIDYNHDNAFDSTEKIMELKGLDTLVSLFKVPATALTGATRMRIILNYYGPTNDPCVMDLQYGETEDYGIYISENQGPPIPEFFYDKTLSCDGLIQFYDLTSGVVDNWLWDFGDSTTSTLQNPVHTYTQNGTYTVKLTTTNSFGSDTATKMNLISIVTGSYYCDTLIIPDSGSGGTFNTCQGLIMDAGKTGDYPSNCDGYITINPTGFSMVKLTINYFESETNYDYLYIYDGRDTAAPLLAVLNGLSVLDDTVFTSSSESLTLRFTSDGSANKAGFLATWDCIVISDKPKAEFSANALSTCGSVYFKDLSENLPNDWLWDFGDGSTSIEKNPFHLYTLNGTYTVKLKASNSFGSDSLTKPAYITVDNNLFFCDTLVIPDSGFGGAFTTCQGLLMDAGKNLKYHPNTNGTVTIDPPGLSYISLLVKFFDVYNYGDTLFVYDGPDNTYPLIGAYNGTLLNVNDTILSTGESLTLQFITNSWTENEGFEIWWDCIVISDKPKVDFSANMLSTCGPVYFKDLSENLPNDWLWDFGDGSTSIEKNPFHQYIQNGTYTVKLKVSNSFGSDSLTKLSFITVDNNLFFCDTLVIPDFGFGGTFTTCQGLLMDAGKNLKYHSNANGSVTIDPAGLSYVSLLIKFFDVYNYSDTLFVYDGPDTTYPLIGAYNGTLLNVNDTILSTGETLTLQFITNDLTEKEGFEIWWDCIPVTTPPSAKFTPNKLFTCGTVSFSDESTGIPDTWLWNFGDGNTSTEKNPTHTYISNGSYNVTLTVSNPYGNNSYSLINPIVVDATSFLCDTLLFADSATVTFNQCMGLLMDDGGNSNYSNSQKSIVTITPTGNDLVKLTFISFNTESGWDYLYIYDGPDTSSTLIGKYSGTTLPGGGSILSSGKSLTLYFTSDGVYDREGFVIIWECISITQAPAVDFMAINTISCGEISFKDNSTNYPNSWAWDFGDGNTATEKNPVHYYTNNGSYTVRLICGNSIGFDTLVKVNYITIDNQGVYCDTVLVPDSGMGILQTKCEGVLADNGGGDTTYSNNANGFITIETGSASSIELTFFEFEFENNYDYLYLYAGSDTTGNLVGKYTGTSFPGGGIIIIPGSSVTIKLTSDYAAAKNGFILNWKCQYDTLPPVASFTVKQQTPCGKVDFLDQSIGTISTRNWDFGDGQTSNVINPVHFYSTNGVYSVTLIVQGLWGVDTLYLQDAVTIDNNASICDTVLIPQSGMGVTQTACIGNIFDSGGDSNYQSNTDGTVTITTTSDKIIQLTFFSFSFENTQDYLYIYDGFDVMQPLIGSFTGDILPGGGTVLSTGNAITLRQYSDGGINKSGFSAVWECKLKTTIEKEISRNSLFEIYPNPAHGTVYVISKSEVGNTVHRVSTVLDINVTDISGRKVFQTAVKLHTGGAGVIMNVSEFNKGAYIISIRDRKGLVSRKLMLVE